MTDAADARDKRWIALILLCSAQFVVVLDASIVNVALPTIGEALDFSESGLPWVVNAYVLTFGGFLLLGGRLADLLGLAVLLIAFVAIERRSRAPLVPFSIFRVRTITGANVGGILVGASLFSMFFFISLYMQQVLGFSAIKAGLSYLPLAIAIMLSAGIASSLVTKVGFKPILAAGMGFIAIGLVWFSQISVHGSFLADILGPSLFAAVGLGFAFVPVTIAAVSGVEDREQGLASGLINTSQQVGGALGLAVLAAIANSQIGNSHDPAVLTDGFSSAFLVGAGFAVLGLIATLLLIRTADSKAHVELGAEPATESSS